MAEAGLLGLRFHPLRGGFSWAMPMEIVAFDPKGARCEKRCNVCGHFESVIVHTRHYLSPGVDVCSNGFVRTDLEFASNDAKSPLVFCGGEAALALERAELTGLELKPIARAPVVAEA